MQNHRAAYGRQGAHGTPYAVGFLQFGIILKFFEFEDRSIGILVFSSSLVQLRA